MEEIFGLDTDIIMLGTLVGFLVIFFGVGTLAVLNRIVLKVGLRNIPRRPAQTVLIVVGLMLSTLIISSALGTGDTLNHSITSAVTDGLGEIDEILTANLGDSLGLTGSSPYFPVETLDALREQLSGYEKIDGLLAGISENAPVTNPSGGESVARMNILGVETADLGVFGPVSDTGGGVVDISALTGNDVLINEKSAESLEAAIGDRITMFLEGAPVELNVAGIVADGGLAGEDETALLSLLQAQDLFDQPGSINTILVSNLGDERSGADLSEEVTERLRTLLTDQEVALGLKDTLNVPDVLADIRERAEDLPEAMREDLLDIASLLESDGLAPEEVSRLVSHLADDGIAAHLLLSFESANGDPQRMFAVFTLFNELKILSVQDVKADLLNLANTAASGIMSIFIIFGLFSMMAGVMLIFLIFVMLAAERKPEMGIARAVGMQRRHLVQSFVYEGMAYDLMSALVGALLGIGVGMAMVGIMANIFSDDDDGFQLLLNYRWQSFVISYCLGVVLTFVTIFFSAYRASRLNIIAAIRDLPDTLQSRTQESNLRIIGRALAAPFLSLLAAFRYLRRGRVGPSFVNLLLALLKILPPVWGALILWSLVRVSTGALSRGWLTFILGAGLTALGLSLKQLAPYSIGITICLIGTGLMLRWMFDRPYWDARRQNLATAGAVLLMSVFWLAVGIVQGQTLTIALAVVAAGFELIRQAALRREMAVTDLEARNAFTFTGLALLLFWGTPFDSLEWIAPEMSSNIEMFFVSGLCLVIAPVFVIVYNADLITDVLTAVFGRFSRIRPALKTAIAYPLNSRLRTGLTLAMLALVIFTLIVMSSLTTAFSAALEDVDSVTGGWDIVGTVSYNNPIEDIESDLPGALGAEADNVAAVGGYTSMPVDLRQVGAENQEWRSYTARGAQDSYLQSTGHDFKIIADGYGDTKEEVWSAVRSNPNLAVIDAFAIPTREGGGFTIGGPEFRVEGMFIEDESMEPLEIEIREPRSGAVALVTVIAVMDLLSDQFGVIMFPKSVLDGISPDELPVTTYRFKLADDADAAAIADKLESAFVENGLEPSVLADDLEEQREASVAINRLLQGFMASGLLVGIAALGVISLRSVVERRQQIGVLRAIGYRRGMVLTSFLMESSFIALLGILLGVGLGALLSYNLVKDISDDVPGLSFTVPWLQIAIIVTIAYAFSLLTTFLPARQASRIYPAEALRYH